VCNLYTSFLYQVSRTRNSYEKLGPSAIGFKRSVADRDLSSRIALYNSY